MSLCHFRAYSSPHNDTGSLLYSLCNSLNMLSSCCKKYRCYSDIEKICKDTDPFWNMIIAGYSYL